MGEGVVMNKGKGRRLSHGEINHYMKVAKAIWLTTELQEKVDHIYNKERILVPHDQSMETSLG